jgi:cell wall-associated NlpC family hydrolase
MSDEPKKGGGATPSYFDNPRAALKLKKEAMSWIGTPFTEYFQQNFEVQQPTMPKGVSRDIKGAGIDCIGLVQEIMYRTGAAEKFMFVRESGDYQSHQTGDKILDWLRGKVDDPQSKRLAEILTELEIPDAVSEIHSETPLDFFKPGDILVLRHGSLFHMPIIYDHGLNFVNAIPRMGVTEGTIQDSTFSKHLVAAFRLKPK